MTTLWANQSRRSVFDVCYWSIRALSYHHNLSTLVAGLVRRTDHNHPEIYSSHFGTLTLAETTSLVVTLPLGPGPKKPNPN